MAAVEIHLEGQDGKDAAHVAPEEAYPAAPPGPQLGRNEVIDRDAQGVGHAGHAEVEVRRVDQQHGIGPRLGQLGPDAAEQAQDAGQAGQHLHHAHDGQFLHPEQIVLPGSRQVVAAHAYGLKRRVQPGQGGQQGSGLHVAGQLARVDPQGAHGNNPSPSAAQPPCFSEGVRRS